MLRELGGLLYWVFKIMRSTVDEKGERKGQKEVEGQYQDKKGGEEQEQEKHDQE